MVQVPHAGRIALATFLPGALWVSPADEGDPFVTVTQLDRAAAMRLLQDLDHAHPRLG